MKGWSFRPIARGCVIGSALLLFIVAGRAWAQGTISGTVKVPAGKAASLALVNATDSMFHDTRTPVNDDGTFSLTDLTADTYTVVVVGRGLETMVMNNVVVKDGQEVKQSVTLKDATPFCIVRAPAPIPLTDDIDSASFADAPEIRLDQGYQRRGLGSGNLTNWNGPTELSGRFRFKFSDQALHLASDLTFKTPGVNNETNLDQVWNGNSIEFFWQNDPLDLTRNIYDLNHDWQLDFGLGKTTTWRLYQRGMGSVPKGDIASLVLRKPTATGERVRIDMPWSIFPDGGEGMPGIKAPKNGDIGAMDIVVNGNDPDDKDNANVKGGLSWSGFDGNWQDPSGMKPIQFCAQAP